MNIEIPNKIGALFKLVVRKQHDDSIVKETDFFHNLVLDTGLNRMSVGTWIDRCCVGSSNITPSNTQVALQGFVASTTAYNSDNSGLVSTSPCYLWVRRTWRFAVGVATGNISEVGLGWSNANLWNRALVKDINGNPTTITVLSDEYLDVVSEIRVYPAEVLSGSFNLLDKTGALISAHTYTGKPYLNAVSWTTSEVKINDGSSPSPNYVFSGDIGATVTSQPSGSYQRPSVSNIASSHPTARSAKSVITFSPSEANGFAHKSFLIANTLLGSNNGFQIQISPTISKTASQTLKYNFTLSWDRYTP